MNYFGIVSLFNGIVALMVGIYVYLRDRKNQLYISFSIFTTLVALWAIFYSLWQSQTSRVAALFVMRLVMVPCYYIPFAFLWFTVTLLEMERKKYLPLCLIVPTLFLPFAFSKLNVKDVVQRLSIPFWPEPGLLMHFYVTVFFLTLIYTFYLLFRNWFQASGMRRWQLKWVTVTMLLTWIGGSTNWFLWYDIPVPPFANFFVGVFLLLLAYPIIRRQLFNIDTLADYIHEAKLSAIGILAASLFHEIRSPLFVAKGYAESLLGDARQGRLLRLPPEDQERRIGEKLEKVITQLDRVSSLAQRFLDFSKPTNSHTKLESIHLKTIVGGVLSWLSQALEKDKVSIQNDINSETTLNADQRNLEEILVNLITNAYQAMKTSGGTLRLVDEKQNGRIRICISDTGNGIPSDRVKRIFEPFYTTKDKGTGLGLYITKKLVEKNRGRIFVESFPQRGTTFILEFPSKSWPLERSIA